jgi:hypothetical protein
VTRTRVPPLPHSTACPRRAVVATPTAAGACLRTEAFRGAEIRNPNLETRDKVKFPIFQCPKLAAGQSFKSLSAWRLGYPSGIGFSQFGCGALAAHSRLQARMLAGSSPDPPRSTSDPRSEVLRGGSGEVPARPARGWGGGWAACNGSPGGVSATIPAHPIDCQAVAEPPIPWARTARVGG